MPYNGSVWLGGVKCAIAGSVWWGTPGACCVSSCCDTFPSHIWFSETRSTSASVREEPWRSRTQSQSQSRLYLMTARPSHLYPSLSPHCATSPSAHLFSHLLCKLLWNKNGNHCFLYCLQPLLFIMYWLLMQPHKCTVQCISYIQRGGISIQHNSVLIKHISNAAICMTFWPDIVINSRSIHR